MSNRPFEFEDGQHRNCRALEHAFGDSPVEAARVVRSKEFDSWLLRGVSDTGLVERIGEILGTVGFQSQNAGDDVVVARVCIALDPMGPLRYNKIVANPKGLGGALAAAMNAGDDARVGLIHDCIAKGLPGQWLAQQALDTGSEASNPDKDFRRLQQLFKHTGPGYGMERALYEMNPFIACQSEMLKRDYIYSLRDLLDALERIVRDTGELPVLIDRHIAAFIAARLKAPTEQILTSIDDGGKNALAAKLGMVKLLGAVQKDYGPDALPNLTGWLSEELSPTIDQFESKSMRDDLKRKLSGVVAKGRLSGLHDHLNSKQLVKLDQAAKKQAVREFAEAAVKIEQLESKEFQEGALRTGWGIAAGASLFLAIVTVAILVIW
jgi:hypothetical protein